MFSKIIFILAMVCFINASVLTVNVFDDDPDTEAASIPRDCNFRACDQLCRRLKFPGGACVNGRCKCDKFLNAEDEVSEENLSDLRNKVSVKDDTETQFASNPKDCNFRACDQQCHRLEFSGGACVNGRCKCDNFLNAEDKVSEKTFTDQEYSVLQKHVLKAEVAENPSRCNLKACDLLCRWLNKTSGSCIDGRCKCARSLIAEDEAEVPTSPKKCTFRACYSHCRSGNYISGACVNGRCKCSNSTNAKDHTETEIENKKSDCNNQACDQFCRRLKFPGDACDNERCECDNFLSSEESLSNSEDYVSPRACNNQKWDLANFFRGGACIEGKCVCSKIISEQEGDMTDPAEFLSPGGCDFRACDQQCFRFGYPGGACVNGRCKCDKFLKTEDTMTNSAESLPLSSCNSIACDDQCRRTGWHSGVCINGQCKCDYFLNADVSENSVFKLEDSVLPRKCTHQECNTQCRRLKFLREGVCIAGCCRCYNCFPAPKHTLNDLEESISVESLDDNFLSTEDEVSDEYLPVSELSEDQTERGCNMRACDLLCRSLRLPGGTCVNGRCKCRFFGTEVAVDEYSESATRHVCKLRQCNRTCTRRGYEGSRCVNGWCKCHNKIQKQDASPLNDVNSDEKEESKAVLKTNEEELIVPSPSACSTVNCNQMCRRLKYAGGWCRFGQCQCF